MKVSYLLVVFIPLLTSCYFGNEANLSIDDEFWDLIERAWMANEQLYNERAIVLRKKDKKLVYGLESKMSIVMENLEQGLKTLDKEQLTRFNQFVEKKLYLIDRAEIHKYTDGGDDSFYYNRGFILALGKEYYEKINRKPRHATFDAECETICFLGYSVYEDKFNKEFERYQYHDATTGSNIHEW